MTMQKTYDPKEIESRIFDVWYESGFFNRNAGGFADESKAPYTIVIPPPNVTGVLHMGHALNESIQDACARKARMQGRPTRWIVGTDHAGIATQNVVERMISREQGKTRFDLGREHFVEQCWEWCGKYGSTIIEQLKSMGCSCDYDNKQFTMDEDYAQAVRKVFVEWYKAGLVFKGHRIINWCPRCHTALADDEVEHADEAGNLWYLRYPIAGPRSADVGENDYIVVATTRPETMLGDSGVAVNPNDERYKHLIGKTVVLPLMNREIPIFADDLVDPEFGTGCVKVTPAHDPNDFEMGLRADLEQINIFTEQAVINENGGAYEGLSREDARVKIVEDLESLGLLDHIEEHEHAVGHCYRCDSTVEPWLSDQWFVAMKKLADPAIEAVRDGRVKFSAERWEKIYFNWMENIRDWCISRQLWWGHRIPVFYCDKCGWIDALEEDATVCPECGGVLRQDEDVLDTWFSSQLWPFATFGWPGNEYEPLKANYPTQVLSTARDIIFLWVARMVISSMYFIDGEVPFSDVIVHPTVLDAKGRRMSKSLGNGVDPLELIEKFGADGMRFGLLLQVTSAQDMKFDEKKLESSRNFATKIWNAARFVLMNLDGDIECKPAPTTLADRWIFSRLAKITAKMNDEEGRYDFGANARAINDFFWSEFCDWYLEFSKTSLSADSTKQNLVFVLDTALRLLHPMMPFVTEEIWQKLPIEKEAPSLMVAAWPDAETLSEYIDETAESAIELLQSLITNIRAVRSRYKIAPREKLNVIVKTSASVIATIESEQKLVESLAGVDALTLATDVDAPKHSAIAIAGDLEIYIPLEGLIDIEAELEKLLKEKENIEGIKAKVDAKLANESFVGKAKPEVVEKAKADAAELADALSKIDAQLTELKG